MNNKVISILPELTKTYILERLSEEQIMEKYLGIAVNNDSLQPNSLCSPLRVDNNPSCNYWYNNSGKLRFKDWTGHFHGDCFDVVAYRLSINSRDRKGFQLILHTIAKDFRIHRYKDIKEVNKYEQITKEFFNKKKHKSIVNIKVVPRKFNYKDEQYWRKFEVDTKLLNIGKVYAVEELYISKNNRPYIKIYRYSSKDPSYAYFGGYTKKGLPKWKVYFPFRNKKGKKNPRFLSSYSFLQGKHLVRPNRFCVITKAYKDVLTFRRFNIMAVAPSAESTLITKSEYWFLRNNCDFLVSCMDYDRTGKIMAKKLRDTYGILPIMLTDGYYNTYDYGSKDPSDYVSANGYSQSLLLFKTIFEKYEKDIYKFDNWMYNNLKFIR